MDFGQPNAEIGQKMANGRLLFLALGTVQHNFSWWSVNILTNTKRKHAGKIHCNTAKQQKIPKQ